MLHIVILAGGSGTRFWPLSSGGTPKQFLKLMGNRSLIEETMDRLQDGLSKSASVQHWICTTSGFLSKTEEHLSSHISGLHLLGEPKGCNTAPAILFSLLNIQRSCPQEDPVIVFLPADHYIPDSQSFVKDLGLLIERSKQDLFIHILGVVPDRPETGYGYIHLGKPIATTSQLYQVESFVEKPDVLTAQKYVSSGQYLWNCGIFVARLSVFLSAFQRCLPQLVELFIGASSWDEAYSQLNPELALSIDHGVMEPLQAHGIPLYCLRASFKWNDLGAFTALEDVGKNTQGEVLELDSGSNIVLTDTGIVALLGVNDLIVVRHGNKLLISAKDRAQEIKKIVERLKKEAPEYL